MLYLLASGPVQTRQAVAQLLGVHRKTVGPWLAIDEARGLDALLDLYVPAGKPLSLPPGVLAALEQALRHPTGFASYAALRQWVKPQHHLEVNDPTLYSIVRTKLTAKLTMPRPSHTPNPQTPSRHVTRFVRSGWHASFHLTTPGRCAWSVRTKAGSAC